MQKRILTFFLKLVLKECDTTNSSKKTKYYYAFCSIFCFGSRDYRRGPITSSIKVKMNIDQIWFDMAKRVELWEIDFPLATASRNR